MTAAVPYLARGGFIALGLLLGAVVLAAECEQTVARVVSIQGSVELRRADSDRWEAAAVESDMCPGDSLRTAERSRAALRLANASTLRLDQHTTLTLAPGEQGLSIIEMLRGALNVVTRTPKPFTVRTPFINAGVEGTEFLVRADDDGARITVFEGTVSAVNPLGAVALNSGEAAFAARGAAPRRERIVRPADAVQWAMYYPSVIGSGGSDEAPVREADALARRGLIANAFARLDAVPIEARSAHQLAFRAELLLLVGRVDEARAEIERVLAASSGASDARALLAIIAVVRNEATEALLLAREAVEVDPGAAAARIALSYAEQARFDLPGALASAGQAVALASGNALAWARVAELQMSSGDLDAALAAAQRASNLEPNLARTQSVLGFASLTRIETAAARQAFDRAVELDPSDPLPRLGLGLARIREGNLLAGREQIEIAASLDPLNSLVRSYLGKAYYEERREALAGSQFDLAKALDPKDPTPWFYDAIRKQAQNRPVQALRELEQSIALNDNRAVYRSRLLLDQDVAARAASLARVYDELGFEQRGLVEAARSLGADPANHSAHRFLSDVYARLPRHEIARVSELLQAQLLQPLNINPVPPSLAFSDLGALDRYGPGQAGLNEYAPLFERDRVRFSASGVLGNHGIRSDEVVLSGIANRISYSVGQYYFNSDGFRQNSGSQHKIYSAFAQLSVTPRLNIQAELRHRHSALGDVVQNFDPANFDARAERDYVQDIARVGARVSIAPDSDLLVSIIRSRRQEQKIRALNPDVSLATDFDQSGNLVEAQYLLRRPRFNATFGVAHYSLDGTLDDELSFAADGLVFDDPPASSVRSRLNSAYLYLTGNHSANLSSTVGLSYTSFDDRALGISVGRWNPKFGLQWKPGAAFALRLAALKSAKRVLAANQSIEPTQIAGFNQFFDDLNNQSSTRYGIGVDLAPTNDLQLGLELSRRKVGAQGQPGVPDRNEKSGRAYLYLTPSSRWSLESELVHDEFARAVPPAGDTAPILARTTQVPIVLRHFAPGGLLMQLGLTGLRQRIERNVAPGFGQGRSHFVLVDFTIGYRFPGRRAMLALEGRNLTDRKFAFQDDNYRSTEPISSSINPSRSVFLRATVSY